MPQTQWENLASLLSLVAAFLVLLFPSNWFHGVETIIRRWSRQRLLCLVLIPGLSLIVNACIAKHNGIPTPKIHDEFSYLLAGDTFAHGRLTNPTPPFAEHFETPQELTSPTRMSKYPPGQGLFLALGQRLGEPIFGVWISTALACVAIHWMLLGFTTQPWAIIGGVMAAISPVLLDWSGVYWGGSVAVLGGALLVGAWGRLMIASSVAASLWLGIGLLVLANSRPFEGVMFSIALVISLLIYARNVPSIVPAALVLLTGALWMGHYNQRVTGHFLSLPYSEYERQYGAYPLFWFQSPGQTPTYLNPSQQWVHTVSDRLPYDQLQHASTAVPIFFSRIGHLLTDNLKLAILLPAFFAAFLLLRDQRVRWIFIALILLSLGAIVETYSLPHYYAPATAGIFLLVILGTARIRAWSWKGKSIGTSACRAIAAGYLAGVCMSASRGVSADSQIANQAALSGGKQLRSGRHLVFVRYESGYQFSNEFVYNPADLDSSRILWVHYFGPEADRPVADHYSGRHIWLLDAGKTLLLSEISNTGAPPVPGRP